MTFKILSFLSIEEWNQHKRSRPKMEQLPDIVGGHNDHEQLQNADRNACTGQTGGQSQL